MAVGKMTEVSIKENWRYSPMTWNDDAFARIVAEEVKNKVTPSQRQELRSPENWHRWKQALLALSENLQNQIDNIEADEESDKERYTSIGRGGVKLANEAQKYYFDKTARVKKFKYHVDKRLDEVCVMIETGEVESNDGWEEVEFYRRAIITHRRMLEEFDLEDTAIDRALWDALDHKWSFDAISNDNL